MTVEKRREIERRIITRIVEDALKSGFTLSVDNGGDEFEIEKSANRREVLDAMMATDQEHLYFHDNSGRNVGAVFLVYGNDGTDVICDYSSRHGLDMDQQLKGAMDLADKIENDILAA